jgi:hypothetical protein
LVGFFIYHFTSGRLRQSFLCLMAVFLSCVYIYRMTLSKQKSLLLNYENLEQIILYSGSFLLVLIFLFLAYLRVPHRVLAIKGFWNLIYYRSFTDLFFFLYNLGFPWLTSSLFFFSKNFPLKSSFRWLWFTLMVPLPFLLINLVFAYEFLFSSELHYTFLSLYFLFLSFFFQILLMNMKKCVELHQGLMSQEFQSFAIPMDYQGLLVHYLNQTYGNLLVHDCPKGFKDWQHQAEIFLELYEFSEGFFIFWTSCISFRIIIWSLTIAHFFFQLFFWLYSHEYYTSF